MPYKDIQTQNNIYESSNFATCDGKQVPLVDLFEEGQIITVKSKFSNSSKTIKIPLDYVINKITGQYVKVGYQDDNQDDGLRWCQDDNSTWYVVTGGNVLQKKCYYKLVKVKLWKN